MRKLALLMAVGALWLFICAVQALADGGPHVVGINSGTTGLSGDCASCHRAHTAQAADLLKATVPGLCTNCHNGTKATTDVLDGVQYTPTGVTGTYQQTTVLGALRGGGFDYALIDTANAARLVYGGTQTIEITGAPTGGTFTLTFNGQTTGALAYNASAGTVQAALVALSSIGTSTTYTTSTAAANMSGTHPENAIVALSGSKYTVTFQNAMRLAVQPLITADASGLSGGTSPSIVVADATAARATAAVGVRAVANKVATTSTHSGAGTVWGNGAVGSGAGPTVTLDCAKCHNPHGNGQYRILQATPGEDWATTNPAFEEAAQKVEVADVGSLSSVKNYTVLPGLQASDVITAGYAATAGDYFRKAYDPSGAANWTNFYLKTDPMNTGWNGASPTNAAANGGVAPANTTGLMTAWCITCHTRYSGLTVGGAPSSLQDNSGGDTLFTFKHGTTRIGCEQCHVSHGSNAQMTAAASSTVEWPGGTTGSADSRLLKVDNRGTCNLCHDPTGTVDPGTGTGPVPGSITPGP